MGGSGTVFDGTLLAVIRALLICLCIWRRQPSWGGKNAVEEAGVAAPPHPLALLELSGLDCGFQL